MAWQDPIRDSVLSWLLEPDSPGVRYLALRDLFDLPADAPELRSARRKLTRKDRSGKYWPKWNPLDIGPSLARGITRNTAQPSGRLSCWLNWVPQ